MDKEKTIIKFLKEEKKASATKISRDLKMHYYEVRDILLELSKKNIIKFEKNRFGNYKFWSLKE